MMANEKDKNGESIDRLGYDGEAAAKLQVTKGPSLSEEQAQLQMEIDKVSALMVAAGIDENDPDLYTDDDPE